MRTDGGRDDEREGRDDEREGRDDEREAEGDFAPRRTECGRCKTSWHGRACNSGKETATGSPFDHLIRPRGRSLFQDVHITMIYLHVPQKRPEEEINKAFA